MDASCTLSLAQLPGASADGAPIPMLPDPPVLEAVLFESPWVAVGILVIAAAGTLWALNRAGRAKQGVLAAAGLVAIAVGIVAVASMVITVRESLVDRTRRLVAAVASGDSAAAGSFLAEDVTLRVLGGRPGWTKDRIVRDIDTRLRGEFGVKDHAILAAAAAIDGSNAARTQVRVRVVSEAAGVPNTSWWRLNWRQDPDGRWRVTGIEALQIDWVSPGEAAGALGR